MPDARPKCTLFGVRVFENQQRSILRRDSILEAFLLSFGSFLLIFLNRAVCQLSLGR